MSQPTGKEKASRIPLDYHRRADPLVRLRLWLTAVAVTLAAGYVSWGFIAPGGATQHSRGPVAAVHASWETQCSACHDDFTPIRNDAWMASWTSPNDSTPWGKLADDNCRACHAGPAHAAREKPAEVASCASCHQEHQGIAAQLARMDDQHCTRCHANLNDHIDVAAGRGEKSPGQQDVPLATTIRSWQSDHPEFRSLKRDPGSIKFTHARHMSLGLKTSADDRVQFKLTDIDESLRGRYRRDGQQDADLVQLDCSSCHQSDSVQSGAALAAGDYMLPISYEQHCRACHPLSIDPQQPAELLPHGLSPERIRRELLGRLSERLLDEEPEAWKPLLQSPIPQRQGEQPQRQPLDLLTQQVFKSEQHVRGTCAKCHSFSENMSNESELPASLAPSELSRLLPRVRQASIPSIWLTDGRFDHASHRSYECRTCHERAYAEHPQASKDSHDVLIAGRESCLECHRPAEFSATGQQGGARHDCSGCHRYHAADHPPHGRGFSLRDALQKTKAGSGQRAETHNRLEAP